MSSRKRARNKSMTTSPTSTRRMQSSSLAPLPPAPPRFPSIEELVEEQKAQASSTAIPRGGLFHELLQSRPEAIYIDSLEHPEKYDEELRTLLSELVNTRRQPSSEERTRLDAAVVSFMEAPKPQRAAAPPAPKPQPKAMPEFEIPAFAQEAAPIESSFEPTSSKEPRAFWWL